MQLLHSSIAADPYCAAAAKVYLQVQQQRFGRFTKVTNMAYTNMARAAHPTGLGTYWAGIADRYKRYRVYRTTLRELRALSPRELDDLNLNAARIRACAYKAAYEG